MLFFVFLVVLNSLFTISVKLGNARLKLASPIPTSAPITVANDVIEMLPVFTDKTSNNFSKQSKEAMHFLSLFLINFLSLISVTE